MTAKLDMRGRALDESVSGMLALLRYYLVAHCNMKLGPNIVLQRRLTPIGREYQLVTQAREVYDRLAAGVPVGVDEALQVLRTMRAAIESEKYTFDAFLTDEVERLIRVLEPVDLGGAERLRSDFLELMSRFRRSVFADRSQPGQAPVRRVRQVEEGSELDLTTRAALSDPEFTTGYLGLLRMRGTLDMIRRRYCGHEANPSQFDARTVSRIRGNPELGPAAAALYSRVDVAAHAARPGWEAARRGEGVETAEPTAYPPAPAGEVVDQSPDSRVQHTWGFQRSQEVTARALARRHNYGEADPPADTPSEENWAALRPLASLGRETMRRLPSGLLVPVSELDLAPLREPGSHDAEVLLGAALRSLPLLLVAEGGAGRTPRVVGALVAERDEPVTLLRWLLEAFERGSRTVLVVDTRGQDEYGRFALLSALAPDGLGFKPG